MTDEPTRIADSPAEVDELTSAGPGSLEDLRERRRRRAELHVEKQRLNAELRGVNHELAKLDERLLDDYAELGTNSADVMLESGRRYVVFLQDNVYAGPVKTSENDKGERVASDEDWERAIEALRKAGLAHFVHERFNVGTLKSWAKEQRDELGPGWLDELKEKLGPAVNIDAQPGVRVNAK